jgi:translocation and assembly module TamA
MKKIIQTLLGTILLTVCLSVWAQVSSQKRFVGISGAMLKNVQTRLKIKQSPQEVEDDIKKALEPYGYFNVQVSSRLSTYYIKLGPPVRITKLDIKISGEAARDRRFKKLLNKFPIKQGDIFVSANYQEAKQALFDLAARRGYLEAKMEASEVKINVAKLSANIILHFASGPRYFFGPIGFSKTPFSGKFLHKFVTFKPGEYYSDKKVKSTQDNFNSSGLFQSVSIDSSPQKAKNLRVPMTAHIIPHKSQRYNFGLGYGTDTGARGSFGLDLYNLTSDGQHFSGIVKVASNKEANFEAHYIIPGKNPVTDRYDLSVGSQVEDYDFGKGYLVRGAAGYTTVLYGWQQTLKLNLHNEGWKFEKNDEINDRSYHNVVLFVPSINWLRRKANDAVRPTSGYRINVLTQGSIKDVMSNVNFVQVTVDAKAIYPIFKGPLLVVRGGLGYTGISKQAKSNLPLSFWFTAGGAESIRGYTYQDIGPGTKLAVGSIELRQRLFGNFYGAVFYDIGTASDKLNIKYKKGAGLGMVWLSPIGAMQLSFAKPIDRLNLKPMVQFSMGAEL